MRVVGMDDCHWLRAPDGWIAEEQVASTENGSKHKVPLLLSLFSSGHESPTKEQSSFRESLKKVEETEIEKASEANPSTPRKEEGGPTQDDTKSKFYSRHALSQHYIDRFSSKSLDLINEVPSAKSNSLKENDAEKKHVSMVYQQSSDDGSGDSITNDKMKLIMQLSKQLQHIGNAIEQLNMSVSVCREAINIIVKGKCLCLYSQSTILMHFYNILH